MRLSWQKFYLLYKFITLHINFSLSRLLCPFKCSFLPKFSIHIETKYEDNKGNNDHVSRVQGFVWLAAYFALNDSCAPSCCTPICLFYCLILLSTVSPILFLLSFQIPTNGFSLSEGEYIIGPSFNLILRFFSSFSLCLCTALSTDLIKWFINITAHFAFIEPHICNAAEKKESSYLKMLSDFFLFKQPLWIK